MLDSPEIRGTGHMRATRRTKPASNSAPQPFSSEELATIRGAQASFQFFLMHVFPKSFSGKKFRLADRRYHEFELGEIHYIWAKIAQENARVCILAPRAHLKSTILNHAFSFWKLFRANQDVDGIVMSFKDTLAQEHTTKIKGFIKTNPYCRMWVDLKKSAESVVDFSCTFGEGRTWRGQIDPYGVMSAVRGLHPKFLVCDDILSDFANALEPKQIRRIDAIFRQSLESLPDEDDSLVVIGTPQSYEDTLYQLKNNSQYYWGRFPAEFGDGQTLWPEKFDNARLRRTRNRVKDRAYQVEYMLVPVLATNSFIPVEVVEACIDKRLRRFSLDEPFNPAGTLGCYGGMDIGKHVHPTHLSVFALMPTGDLVQVYQEFLDGMDYRGQAKRVKQVIGHFKVRRFYYDNTRAEMEDRNMPKQAIGMAFSQKLKAQMALSMESRFFADEEEMGIILLDDKRQTGQIVSVDKTLKSVETSEGHGDAFWSTALALRAADDGPVMQILGDAQDMFGGIRKRNPLLAGRNT